MVAEGGADGTALPPTIGARETAPDDGELLIPTGPAVFEPAAVIRATNPAAVTEESLLNTIVMLASVDVTGAGRLLPLYEPSKRAVSDPSYNFTKSYATSVEKESKETETRPAEVTLIITHVQLFKLP